MPSDLGEKIFIDHQRIIIASSKINDELAIKFLRGKKHFALFFEKENWFRIAVQFA